MVAGGHTIARLTFVHLAHDAIEDGVAPDRPVTLSIGIIGIAHPDTDCKLGVKPIVQLSLKPLVVPVLAAACRARSDRCLHQMQEHDRVITHNVGNDIGGFRLRTLRFRRS
jgi:hypothetical protein